VDPLLIQRPPFGLPDLLGLKGVGQAPIRLAETISATLADCVDYYLVSRRETVTGTTGVAMVANTAYTCVTVPASEIWFVYNFTVRLSAATAAATAIRFWGTYAFQTSSGFPIPLTETVAVGASDNGAASRSFARPMLFGPGCVFGISSGAVTGVPGASGRVTIDACKLTL